MRVAKQEKNNPSISLHLMWRGRAWHIGPTVRVVSSSRGSAKTGREGRENYQNRMFCSECLTSRYTKVFKEKSEKCGVPTELIDADQRRESRPGKRGEDGSARGRCEKNPATKRRGTARMQKGKG